MKKYSLFEFMFTLFIFALVVLFMAVPQALSRSPDLSPILGILDIEQSQATFQAIENQLFYNVTNARQEIILFRESHEPMLISIGQDLDNWIIIRPVLLL